MGKVEQVRSYLKDPFAGFTTLTQNERRALRLASRGFTNRDIARAMNTTDANVAYYLRTGLLKIDRKKSDLPNMIIATIESIVG